MMLCPMTNSGCNYTAQCIGVCRHLPTDAGIASRIAALEAELVMERKKREQAIAEVECLWMAITSHCSSETIKAIEAELVMK